MTFRQLCGFFEILEKTTLRNRMVEILADLFRKTAHEEVDKIIYLLQGRVSPIYDNLEFGMAQQLVIASIASAFDVNEAKVVTLFKQKGDLGETAEILKETFSSKSDSDIAVEELYRRFLQITQTTGAGSVKSKKSILSALLKESDSLSCRYLVRMLMGKIRLGFSDMTILDALSYMLVSDKSLRTRIEEAYNVRPDLGFIAKTVKHDGIAGLKSTRPQIGTPILMARADRLATASEIIKKIGRCAVEYKYDGLRLQVHYKKTPDHENIKTKHQKKQQTVRMFSRNLEDVTAMFPDIEKALPHQVKANELIFEGEVVAYNPKTGVSIPFQQTMQRKRKYDIEKLVKEVPVKLYAFELLYFQGENLIGKPYTFRHDLLAKSIGNGEVIKVAKQVIVDNYIEINNIFDRSMSLGYEGIIAKRLDGEYQAGMRGFNWIKYKKAMSEKLVDTLDVLVMGYTKGEGKRTVFGVGQFLTGVYDEALGKFTTVSKIGTGLTDLQFREFFQRVKLLRTEEKPKNYEVDKLLTPDVWLEPSLVVEVAADEVTRSQVHTAGRLMGLSKSGKAQEVKDPGYALRFPRLIGFRQDKNPQDATTLTELKNIFIKQKNNT